MDLTTIGSVTAYARSVKTAVSVRDNMSAGFSGSRSDTSAFSAQARAAARLAKEQPSREDVETGFAAIKEAADKAAAENAEKSGKTDSSKPSDDKKADETIVQGVENVKDKDGKTVAELIKEQTEKLENLFAQKEYDKTHDNRLGAIKAKMRTGMTLSPSEQQYLAAKDPDAYSVFRTTEDARISYRYSLNACRTKDEVNAMRLSNALSALSAYKKAIKNGGDGSAVAGLNAALDREIRAFTSSASYKRLPTVAECNKFDRDLAKAKRNEREKKLAEKRRQEAKRQRTLAAKRAAAKKAKYKKTPGDGKQTVAQVMSSPTARKVLASRAKSSCCAAYVRGYNSAGRFYSKA